MGKQSEALSPWGMPSAKYVEISPLKGSFKAQIALPGSKSFTNRALILAALAEGTSYLRSPLFSDDSYWCVDALKKLGVDVQVDCGSDVISIEGIGNGNLHIADDKNIPYIGSAGTIARFLPGVVAARGEGDITLTSSDQLARRPVIEMITALRALGANIQMPERASFPMVIKGGSLIGGEATVSGAISSQFISGILLAAPLAKIPVTLKILDHIVQSDYVCITLALMEQFGVKVDYNNELTEFRIKPQNYFAEDLQLEADASTSTYFFSLAAATKSEITITNLNPDTLQPDFGFVEHLKTLGCDVTQVGTHVNLKGPEQLSGGKSFDFTDCSDSTPALVGISPFANGPIEVKGVAHIRTHECDRLSVMSENLTNAGVSVTEHADGLEITPVLGAPRYATVNPHDDHRMAMAFSVMAAVGNGGKILDPSCVSKTCPNFFDLISRIGVKCEVR